MKLGYMINQNSEDQRAQNFQQRQVSYFRSQKAELPWNGHTQGLPRNGHTPIAWQRETLALVNQSWLSTWLC